MLFFLLCVPLKRSNCRVSKTQNVFRWQKPSSCFTKTLCFPPAEASAVLHKGTLSSLTDAAVVFHKDALPSFGRSKCCGSQRRCVFCNISNCRLSHGHIWARTTCCNQKQPCNASVVDVSVWLFFCTCFPIETASA